MSIDEAVAALVAAQLEPIKIVMTDMSKRLAALENSPPAPTPPAPPAPPDQTDPRILEAPKFSASSSLVVGSVHTRVIGNYVPGATPIAGERFRNGVSLGDMGARADYAVVAADAGQKMRYIETVRMPDGTTFPAESAEVVPVAAVVIVGTAQL